MLAVSDDGPRRCLVLELCGGGSLHKRLKELSCLQRLEAAGAVGSAVVYLHTLNPPVIHRDLKPTNILVTKALITADVDMRKCIKVSDFGCVHEFVPREGVEKNLASCEDVRKKYVNHDGNAVTVESEKTHDSTAHIIGTLPFMPNEYALYGHVTIKTDAFAFGILLLILLSNLSGSGARKLVEMVLISFEPGELLKQPEVAAVVALWRRQSQVPVPEALVMEVVSSMGESLLSFRCFVCHCTNCILFQGSWLRRARTTVSRYGRLWRLAYSRSRCCRRGFAWTQRGNCRTNTSTKASPME